MNGQFTILLIADDDVYIATIYVHIGCVVCCWWHILSVFFNIFNILFFSDFLLDEIQAHSQKVTSLDIGETGKSPFLNYVII